MGEIPEVHSTQFGTVKSQHVFGSRIGLHHPAIGGTLNNANRGSIENRAITLVAVPHHAAALSLSNVTCADDTQIESAGLKAGADCLHANAAAVAAGSRKLASRVAAWLLPVTSCAAEPGAGPCARKKLTEWAVRNLRLRKAKHLCERSIGVHDVAIANNRYALRTSVECGRKNRAVHGSTWKWREGVHALFSTCARRFAEVRKSGRNVTPKMVCDPDLFGPAALPIWEV